MKSTPIRKPEKDILLAPGNAALILVDYQPPQVATVESMDRLMRPREMETVTTYRSLGR